MGASKRDMHKKSRQYEDSYPYETDGVKAILRDIYRLGESQYLNGDIDATIILTDLKMALDSGCLTPRMRQVVALYYFVGFTLEEIKTALGLANKSVPNSILVDAVERVSSEMDYGYKQSNNARIDATIFPKNYIERPLFKFLNEIASGDRSVYEVNDEVFSSATRYLASIGDHKAVEVIRQEVEGFVWIEEDAPNDDEYLTLTWEQMRWDDRRVSYVPVVYPVGDILGRRKVAIKLRDGDRFGNEWIIERRAMFQERN
jgi:hypothetical protein